MTVLATGAPIGCDCSIARAKALAIACKILSGALTVVEVDVEEGTAGAARERDGVTVAAAAC